MNTKHNIAKASYCFTAQTITGESLIFTIEAEGFLAAIRQAGTYAKTHGLSHLQALPHPTAEGGTSLD